MTNPKEDIQKLREFIVSVATQYATEVHGRLQVRFALTDSLDGHLDIVVGPVINRHPWPKKLLQAMQEPPLGSLHQRSTGTCRYLYRLPLSFLPIELRRRRGQSLSAGSRLAQIVAHSCSLRSERCSLKKCKEELQKLRKISTSSMISKIDLRYVAVEAELQRQEREEELMDVNKMGKENELLFIDIARHIGLEEGLAVSLAFYVKDSKYPLAHRSVPYDPT